MGKALIIGCGGVASVTIHKCCQNSDVFEEIMIASRTKSKCDALKAKLDGGKTIIHTAQVDADKVEELVELSGRSLAEISGELLDLQMQGKLGLADGRRYYRI